MSVQLRKRLLPSGKIRLYLAIYVSGQRRYEPLHLYLSKKGPQNKEVMRLAEAIRAKRELDVHAEVEGIAAPWKRETNIFDYGEDLFKSKSKAEQKTCKNSFSHLKSFAGEKLTFARVTERFCTEFQTYLLSRLSRNSAAAYFARFKSVVKTATKEGYLRKNPADEMSIRTVETLPKFLTYEQLQELIKVPCGNPTVRDAFLFSVNTGLRYIDVRSLVWSQVDGDSIAFTQSKTGSPEIMPLNGSAVTILQRQAGHQERNSLCTGQVFVLPRSSSVDKVLRTWGRRAGLSVALSYHRARHTFATLMVGQDVNIYTLSKLLGHKSVATT
jgi:integrase